MVMVEFKECFKTQPSKTKIDWRFPTTHHELTDLGFFPQIQQLVEDIVEANGKKVKQQKCKF